MTKFRAAPLGSLSKAITALALLATATIALAAFWNGYTFEGLLVLGVLALLLLTGLLAVRSYAVGTGRLAVRHPLWNTWIDLSDLEDAARVPELANEFSMSLLSTRGCFGQIGYGFKKSLGMFLMYVTDPSAAVVLRFSSRKPIVLSPESPDDFLTAVSAEIRSRKEGGCALSQ